MRAAAVRAAAARRGLRVVGVAACGLCVLAYLAGQASAGEMAGQAALLGAAADPAAAVRGAMLSQLVRLMLVGIFAVAGLVLTPRLGLPREAFLLSLGLVYLLLLPLEVWASLPPQDAVSEPDPAPDRHPQRPGPPRDPTP